MQKPLLFRVIKVGFIYFFPPGEHVYHSSDLRVIKYLHSQYANGCHSLPSVIHIKINQDILLFTHAFI